MKAWSEQAEDWVLGWRDTGGFGIGFSYLACPIRVMNPDDHVSFGHRRDMNGHLLLAMARQGFTCYSPLLHWLSVAPSMGEDWETWKKVSLDMIDASSRIIVIALPGWRESVGVTAEIQHAGKTGKNVFMFLPDLGD